MDFITDLRLRRGYFLAAPDGVTRHGLATHTWCELEPTSRISAAAPAHHDGTATVIDSESKAPVEEMEEKVTDVFQLDDTEPCRVGARAVSVTAPEATSTGNTAFKFTVNNSNDFQHGDKFAM